MLRWVLPVFLVAMVLEILKRQDESVFYGLLYFGLVLIPIVFIVDYLSRKQQVQIIWLRYIIHFVSMNVALLVGLFRFFSGIRSSVWQPTKRLQ